MLFWTFFDRKSWFSWFVCSQTSLSGLLTLGASCYIRRPREPRKNQKMMFPDVGNVLGSQQLIGKTFLREIKIRFFRSKILIFQDSGGSGPVRSMVCWVQRGWLQMPSSRPRGATHRPPGGTDRCLSWKYLAHAPTYFLERWNRLRTDEMRALSGPCKNLLYFKKTIKEPILGPRAWDPETYIYYSAVYQRIKKREQALR